MTTKEMSDFLNSLWCWARCTEEEQRKLSEIADYLSSQGNEKARLLDKIRAEIENDWQLKKYPSSPFSCGLRHAIEIIDKYKAESEDKE